MHQAQMPVRCRSPPLLQVWTPPTPLDDHSATPPPHDSGIDSVQAGVGVRVGTLLLHPASARLPPAPSPPVSGSSSPASSSLNLDPWDRRRRSSTVTARYSLLDTLDLEYTLLRAAAARGSVCSCSLRSDSISMAHKLTFTQSLAFPALAARASGLGVAGAGGVKRRRRHHRWRRRQALDGDSGLNAFAKIVTALVLMLVSVMVFGVVYKFVRT